MLNHMFIYNPENPIFTATDTENGVKAEINIGHSGKYHVCTFDTDAEEYLPWTFIFDNRNQAAVKCLQITGKIPV